MLIYWELNAGGIQAENFDMEEEDENCEIQKPQMQNTKDEKQMEDPVVNTILIFDLEMINKSVSNNCKSEGFGMQRSKDDLSRISAKLAEIFTQSLGVFAQSSYLSTQLAKKSI